jgi:hypothetical protein
MNRAADLAYGDAGVIVEAAADSAKVLGPMEVRTDPITALVNWAEVTRGATAAVAPPGWTPLVSVGGRVLVARRETPARQVWIGFDSPQWPRLADYVIFWTNVFDWAGGDTKDFVAHPMSVLPESWKRLTQAPPDVQANAWPGVFQRGDNSMVAMNALNVRFPAAGESSSLANLSAAGMQLRELIAWMLLAGMACLLISMLTWRRKRKGTVAGGTLFARNAGA